MLTNGVPPTTRSTVLSVHGWQPSAWRGLRIGLQRRACTTSIMRATRMANSVTILATNVNGGSGTCGFESADGWEFCGIVLVSVNRQGVQFHQQGGTSTFPANVQDPNGNRLTFSCTSGSGACNTPGNVIKMTDSVGRFWWHYWEAEHGPLSRVSGQSRPLAGSWTKRNTPKLYLLLLHCSCSYGVWGEWCRGVSSFPTAYNRGCSA